MNGDERPDPVGAPTEFADAEEFPDWFGNLVKAVVALPILVWFFCGPATGARPGLLVVPCPFSLSVLG